MENGDFKLKCERGPEHHLTFTQVKLENTRIHRVDTTTGATGVVRTVEAFSVLEELYSIDSLKSVLLNKKMQMLDIRQTL